MTTTLQARGPQARTLVIALLACLLACLLALTAAPGAHASAPAKDDKGRTTFGVQPSGPKKPDRRSGFSYSATPGAAVGDHLAVLNHSTRALKLKVYASDAFNTADGGFDLLAAGRPSKDAGTWVAVEKSTVVVPARSRVIVPFTLTVPRGASPGDHAAGIVAALTSSGSGAEGDRVAVEQRVGARIHIRVAGELKPRLTVENLRASYRGTANPFGGGSATVTYTVRNTGNVRIGARQTVRVRNAVTGPVRAPGVHDIKELLPGNAVTVTASVRDLFPALRSTATVTVDPVAVSGDINPALPGTTLSAGFWTVPWALLALLLVLAAGVAVWFLQRRRRGRPRPPAASESLPSVPDSVPASGSASVSHSVSKKVKTSMLTKRFSRQAALGAATLLTAAGGALLLGAPAAQAADPLGTLKVDPATGTDTSGVSLTTSAACPAEADYVIVKVAGKGFPAEGQNVVGNSPISIYQVVGDGYEVPLSETMRDYANTAGFKTLEGRYDFTVTCRNAFGETTYGDFTGSIWFTSNTVYRDTDPAGPSDPPTSTSPSPSQSTDPSTTPSDPSEPSDDPEPSDSADPSDTGLPPGTDDPGTDDPGTVDGGTTDGGSSDGASDGGSTGGGSTDVSTEVGSGGTGGALASTGAQAGLLGLGSAALIALGTAAVFWARRRGLLTFANGGNR
ncbi:hypothetical protein [Streptomyces sp. NBC_00872]|uniref:hypothetical protein n=1 Tax=Streptomyces sp. NBC_00872 TaxID=2903686 RepID=UPI00386B830D|nr:DUF916 domain-containing protein [Streptomyces sp. NBC_00872]